MMQREKTGNILDATHGIIVQQVNAQGVMGSGVAKAIRERYPQVFTDYAKHVGAPYTQKESGRQLLGDVITTPVSEDLIVCSVVTQQFFGKEPKRYTSYDAMDVAFKKVAAIANWHDTEIHYPHIGAGLGGGNWTIISSIIEAHWGTIPHTHWTL